MNVGGDSSLELFPCGPRQLAAEVWESNEIPFSVFSESSASEGAHLGLQGIDLSLQDEECDYLMDREFDQVPSPDTGIDRTLPMGDSRSIELEKCNCVSEFCLGQARFVPNDCCKQIWVSPSCTKVSFHGSEFEVPCRGKCTGVHVLEGSRTQLNPCVFFEESFLSQSGADCRGDFSRSERWVQNCR